MADKADFKVINEILNNQSHSQPINPFKGRTLLRSRNGPEIQTLDQSFSSERAFSALEQFNLDTVPSPKNLRKELPPQKSNEAFRPQSQNLGGFVNDVKNTIPKGSMVA